MRVEAVAILHGLWARIIPSYKRLSMNTWSNACQIPSTEADQAEPTGDLKVRQSFFGVQLLEIVQSQDEKIHLLFVGLLAAPFVDILPDKDLSVDAIIRIGIFGRKPGLDLVVLVRR